MRIWQATRTAQDPNGSTICRVRYLVTAKVKPGQEKSLDCAIDRRTLGRGSIAGDEYLRNMDEARQLENGSVQWVEVCYCPTPLQEERPYWEEYFDLLKVQNAHARSRCRDLNGTEHWACDNCDCTSRLEAWLRTKGRTFRRLNEGKDTETCGGR